VVWGAGLWVAAGGDNNSPWSVIVTSPDGVTWTTRTTPFDNGYVNQVATNFYAPPNRLFMAVGNDASNVKVVMTSPDGVTWTAQTTPFDNGYGSGVWWDGHNWIVVGQNSARTRTIMTSPNGVVWTIRTTPFDAPKDGSANPGAWVVAGDGAGMLVAGGRAGSVTGPMICTSTDHGVTWTARADPFIHTGTSPSGDAIAWVPNIGLWVLGRGGWQWGNQIIATSLDGITWTAQTSPWDGAGSFGSGTAPGFINWINQTGPGTIYPPVPPPTEVSSPGFIPIWD
jgi:hypothetical protein